MLRRALLLREGIASPNSMMGGKGAGGILGNFQKASGMGNRPQFRGERGVWLFNKEKNDAFTAWCRNNGIRARGNTRIARVEHNYARALRANRTLYPGEAIITIPLEATYNFLVLAREQYKETHMFPISIQWNNYNLLIPELANVANHEMAMGGWVARVVSLNTDFAPYFNFLLSDTTGRDGIVSAFSQMRQENGESPRIDTMLSDMALDAAEEPEEFLETFHRAVAAYMRRTILIDPRAIEKYLEATGFLPRMCKDMIVPTMIPLVDCVPQVVTGYNTLIDYFEHRELDERLLSELNLVSSANDLLGSESIKRSGVYVLRAMNVIQEDDVLTCWSWPKTPNWRQEHADAVCTLNSATTNAEKDIREREAVSRPRRYLD